jgi:hypothetical protein
MVVVRKKIFLIPCFLAWLPVLWIGCDPNRSGLVKPRAGIEVPALGLLDLKGKPVNPFTDPEISGNVFVFARIDCPISNRYAPLIRKLAKRYESSGIRFWLVFPDPDTTVSQIRRHMREYEYSMPALTDPGHRLAALAEVRVTPEVGVFGVGTNLLYHGRIDDRFVDFGTERPTATRHELEEVLEAVAADQPVITVSRPGVGCSIADLGKNVER